MFYSMFLADWFLSMFLLLILRLEKLCILYLQVGPRIRTEGLNSSR